MCTVINCYYKIDYEVLNGRKCTKGESKNIEVTGLNQAGALKYILNITCVSNSEHIYLSENQLDWKKSIECEIKLPPSYWRIGTKLPSQANCIYYALINHNAPNGFMTHLEGKIKVSATVINEDLDAIKISKEYPKVHDFYPPLEVI